jgi:hypothetical protein
MVVVNMIRRTAVLSIAAGVLLAAAPQADAGFFQWLAKLLGFDSSKPGKFQIFTGKDGQYYFRLLAANNRNVLQSEGYKQLDGAKNGVRSIIANARGQRTEILQAKDGSWYFVWRAGNYQVTGRSETYVSRNNAVRGADGVRQILMNNPRIFIQDGKRWVPVKSL